MADNFDIDETGTPEPEQQPPKPTGNRNFLIVLGVLGGLFVLAIIVLVLFLVVFLPQSQRQRLAQIAQVNANNTATVAAITAEAASRPTATATRIPPTATSTPTLKPSSTPVVALPTSTVAQLAALDPRTATVAALLTQAAQARLTETMGPTSTQALPKTGFAEDVGIPGLIGIAVLLVVVIFLVRRMRASTTA